MKRGVLIFILLLIPATTIFADVSKTINYQGRLRTTANQPVADGQYMITFRFYDADTGGTKVWEESQLVNTKQGYFNTVLGNSNPFSTAVFNQPLWLGLKVGNEAEMTPRQLLGSVPCALTVANLPLSNMVILTSSGTYTPSAGVRAILVECVGGGGGAGGATQSAGTSAASCGGGGGGYCRKLITSPASAYSVLIGAGGIGGFGAADGTAGGDTTFGNPAILTAGGGNGSSAAIGVSGANLFSGIAAGGTANGGDLNVPGGAGERAYQIALNIPINAAGGNSFYGNGGKSAGLSIDGENGWGYGGAGGGASTQTNGGDKKGGNGAPGIICVWEFK